MDESTIIGALNRALGGRGALAGIGDDGAVLSAADGRVVALDTMVDGVHFDRSISSWTDVGWKLFASNASDLFAMGARPTAWLLSLALPELGDDELAALVRGLTGARDAIAPACVLIGGDTTYSPHAVLSICMHGAAFHEPVGRSGAAPGDQLFVNGPLGLAAAGLAEARAGRLHGPLVDAHRRPAPVPVTAVEVAHWTAAIDVSDGLAIDLHRLATASGARLVVDAPLPGADALGALDESAALEAQWYGGDDYVVVAAGTERPGPEWHRIGHVEQGTADVVRAAGGLRTPMPRRGYLHRFGP